MRTLFFVFASLVRVIFANHNDDFCIQNSNYASSGDVVSARLLHVGYNLKPAYYRDFSSMLKSYTLSKPGHLTPQACANLCILDWRTDSDNFSPLDTDCSVNTGVSSLCPLTSGTVTAMHKCTAFNFHRGTKQCILLSKHNVRKLRGSPKRRWASGFLECEMPMTSPPPPPPSPPPPPPSPPPPPPAAAAPPPPGL